MPIKRGKVAKNKRQEPDWTKVRNIVENNANSMITTKELLKQIDPKTQNQKFYITGNYAENTLLGYIKWIELYGELTNDKNNHMLKKIQSEFSLSLDFIHDIREKLFDRAPTAKLLQEKEETIKNYTDEFYNRLKSNGEVIMFYPEPNHATMLKYKLNTDGSMSIIAFDAGNLTIDKNLAITDKKIVNNIIKRYQEQENPNDVPLIYTSIEYQVEKANIKKVIERDIRESVDELMQVSRKLTPTLRHEMPYHKTVSPFSITKLFKGQRAGNCSARSPFECIREELDNKTFKKLSEFINTTSVADLATLSNADISKIKRDIPIIDASPSFAPTYKNKLLTDSAKLFKRVNKTILGIENIPDNFFVEKLNPLINIEALDYPLTNEMLKPVTALFVEAIKRQNGEVTADNLDKITMDWYHLIKTSKDVPLEIKAAVIKMESQNSKLGELSLEMSYKKAQNLDIKANKVTKTQKQQLEKQLDFLERDKENKINKLHKDKLQKELQELNSEQPKNRRNLYKNILEQNIQHGQTTRQTYKTKLIQKPNLSTILEEDEIPDYPVNINQNIKSPPPVTRKSAVVKAFMENYHKQQKDRERLNIVKSSSTEDILSTNTNQRKKISELKAIFEQPNIAKENQRTRNSKGRSSQERKK